MLFWLFAITITVVACAALYYAAAGRTVNAAGASGLDATRSHFRLQLGEIEADTASGRLGPAEAVAAKAELARELLRQQRDASSGLRSATAASRYVLPASIIAGATARTVRHVLVRNRSTVSVKVSSLIS